MRQALGLAAAAAAISCGSEGTGPSGPDPGPLRVVVTQTPANAGGVVLEITGEITGSVRPLGSYRTWERNSTAMRKVVLLKGTVGTGALLEFSAVDRNGSYSVRVIEAAAAASGGYAPQLPGEYEILVER